MNNSLTIYPYDKFQLINGLNIINWKNIDEYSQLIFHLYQLKSKIKFEDDEDNLLHIFIDQELQKNFTTKINIVGGLQDFNLNTPTNLRLIYKKIFNESSYTLKSEIEQLNTQINNLIFDITTNYDGPLEYDPFANIEGLLKLKLVKISSSSWQNYYDKILSVINFFREFSEKKVLIMHDIVKLLNLEQLEELNDYLESSEINLISFESTDISESIKHSVINVSEIDEDHVRFDY